MKRDIDQYIKENKSDLDLKSPPSEMWNTIEKELHPEETKKAIAWWQVAAAACMMAGGSYYLWPASKTEFAYDQARPGGFQVYDSMTTYNLPLEDMVNEQLLPLELKTEELLNPLVTNPSDYSFGKVQPRIKKLSNQNEIVEIELSQFEPLYDIQSSENGAVGNLAIQNGEMPFPVDAEKPPVYRGRDLDVGFRNNRNQHNAIRGNDGEAFIVPNGGTGAYTYQWTDGSTFDQIGINPQLGTMGHVGAGSYMVQIPEGYELRTKVPNGLFQIQADSITLGNLGWHDPQPKQLEVNHYYEEYKEFNENEFLSTSSDPLSTFGIDVDAAGYSNMRRYINNGFLPPKHAVKLEEMINYFDYNFPEPTGEHPFSISNELGVCPWNEKHQLLQIALKGKEVDMEEAPSNNLVFLLDVSGSMNETNKLPLLKKGFKMLVKNMRPQDRVSIVVYAGAAGVVLEPTSGKNKDKILNALNRLEAGGSTAGGAGINLAYKLAEEHFDKEGNNRIILATDGDFNVGVSGEQALVELIEEKRKTGVFLSVMGFGEGNLQSSTMEEVADNGNGNYSYIDNILEAQKVFVTEAGGTLVTIAKDVKLQVEFNPNKVHSYRLLGYENRTMAAEDFDNDAKDAGELGAGHTVVALYEIIPPGAADAEKPELKYQKVKSEVSSEFNGELATIKFRYKEPDASKSKLLTRVVSSEITPVHSTEYNFSTAVAEFGLLIRDSKFKADANIDALIERARYNKGRDLNGYRTEFVKLAELGKHILEEYHELTEKKKE